jgi:beta-lactamase class A
LPDAGPSYDRRVRRLSPAFTSDTPGVAWGVCVVDVPTGEVLLDNRAAATFSTASVGKLLLLLEVARQFETGEIRPDEMVERTDADAVADSGMWQHLRTPALPVTDLAVLVASVSDNLATNVLLRRLGIEAVMATTARLGLSATALHDRVRDARGGSDPPMLSTGSAAELAGLLRAMSVGDAVSASVSSQVLGWLATGVDLSMVGAAFGLDPLAHGEADRGLTLQNKTGTDVGVRADVGLVGTSSTALAYAALANWPTEDDHRDDVLAAMRRLGAQLRDRLQDRP